MFGHHALDCRLDALLCGDIAVDRIRLAAGICDIGHNLRTTFHVDVGDRDQRAIRRHPDRARAAYAPRRARDHSALARMPTHYSTPAPGSPAATLRHAPPLRTTSRPDPQPPPTPPPPRS